MHFTQITSAKENGDIVRVTVTRALRSLLNVGPVPLTLSLASLVLRGALSAWTGGPVGADEWLTCSLIVSPRNVLLGVTASVRS